MSDEVRVPAPTYPRVVAALVAEFDDVAPSLVERCVVSEVAQFQHARVGGFIEILVHRAARERLRRHRQLVGTVSAELEPATPVPGLGPSASGERV